MLKKYLGRPAPQQTQSPWSPRIYPMDTRRAPAPRSSSFRCPCFVRCSSCSVLTVVALESFPGKVSLFAKRTVLSSRSFGGGWLSLSLSLISSPAGQGYGPHFYPCPKPAGGPQNQAPTESVTRNRGRIKSNRHSELPRLIQSCLMKTQLDHIIT